MQAGDPLDRVKKAIQSAEEENEILEESRVLENLGDLYLSSDNFDLAIAQYERIQKFSGWPSFPLLHKARVYYKMASAHLGLGVFEVALQLITKAEKSLEGEDDPLLVGKVYSLGGRISRRIGNHQDALAYSLRALDILRHTDANGDIALVQLTCGSIFLRQGNAKEALHYFADSLSTYRRIDDEEGIAKAQNNIGVVNKNLCQWQNATDALTRALEIDRRLGNYSGVALRSLNLGLILFQTGEWKAASNRIEESLQMFRGVKDSHGITLCSLALARIARHWRKWTEAKRYTVEALRISRKHGNKREIAAAYEEFGALYSSRGQRRTARTFLEKSLSVALEISEKNDHVAEVSRRLAEEAVIDGRGDEAIAFAKRSLLAASFIRDRRLIGLGLRALAAARRITGDSKLASRYAAKSVEIFEKARIPFELGRSLLELSSIALINNDFGSARSGLARAEAIFRQLGTDRYSCFVLIENARLKIRSDRLEDALTLLAKAECYTGSDSPGEQSDEIQRLFHSIEEKYVTCSLSESNRFLVFRESIRGSARVLEGIVDHLEADRGFFFARDSGGEFCVTDCRNMKPGEALWMLNRVMDQWFSSKDIRPVVSLGRGARNEGSYLAAPVDSSGRSGVFIERKAGNHGGIFDRRDLNFLVALSKGLQFSPELRDTLDPANGGDGFSGVITRNEKMLDILSMLRRLSGVTATILLQGETGTGKGLFAHEISKNNSTPFVTINCADLTETILESELFGHVKNAFTGARTAKKGLFEVADGGTVFIDEIDKTSTKFQEKLLRVVDRREFKPVGSVDIRRVDCRILCASNGDLKDLVERKLFLKDLYYRLKVISIVVPPLRERAEDIPLLVGHFLSRFSREMEKRGVRFSDEAMRLLSRYNWPGNVRDLQNEVERAVALSEPDQVIEIDDLSDELVDLSRNAIPSPVPGNQSLSDMVVELEGHVISEALRRNNFNKSRTARELGLTRKGLRNKINRYGLS